MGIGRLFRLNAWGGLLCAGLAFCSACHANEPHTLGGKTSADLFSDDGVRALADASCVGDVDAINALASSGVEVDGTGEGGLTALIWALTCENHAGMQALLDLGADPNKRMTIGGQSNAVLFAVSYFDESLLRLLLDNGGDPSSYYLSGYKTALYDGLSMGMQHEDWDTFELLFEYGAEPYKTSHPLDRGIIGEAVLLLERCRALWVWDRGHPPRHTDSVFLLRMTQRYASQEIECDRQLVDRLEARLTEEQWSEYVQWARSRDGLVLEYGEILNRLQSPER